MALRENDSTGSKLNTTNLSKKSKGSAESKKREKKDFWRLIQHEYATKNDATIHVSLYGC
jgi:hypothetical protein